jgi:hypothetical protein
MAYPQNRTTERDVVKFTKMIKFALTHLTPNTGIQEAVNELIQFKEKIE